MVAVRSRALWDLEGLPTTDSIGPYCVLLAEISEKQQHAGPKIPCQCTFILVKFYNTIVNNGTIYTLYQNTYHNLGSKLLLGG